MSPSRNEARRGAPTQEVGRFLVHPGGFAGRFGNSSREELTSRLGFTLVELLAILTVLTLLGMAFTSTFASTKSGSAGFVCMNNLRQLGSAWKMYADDSNAGLVYNKDGSQSGKSLGDQCWVGGWLDYSGGSDNTNTALLVNHQLYPFAAYLGPYLKDATIFKCPADESVANIAGHTYPRVRSYSMNNTFGVGSRMWTIPSRFAQHVNLSDVKHPSQLFIFIEEHNGSINDPCFLSDPDTAWQMIDYPAAYHNSGCNLVFVDGHTEQHRWIDSRTTPIAPPGTLLPLNQNLPGDLDVQWLQQHADERP